MESQRKLRKRTEKRNFFAYLFYLIQSVCDQVNKMRTNLTIIFSLNVDRVTICFRKINERPTPQKKKNCLYSQWDRGSEHVQYKFNWKIQIRQRLTPQSCSSFPIFIFFLNFTQQYRNQAEFQMLQIKIRFYIIKSFAHSSFQYRIPFFELWTCLSVQ